jgi:branched-chain amino acid transport system permease protein
MSRKLGYAAVLISLLLAPWVLYPVLLMKILCFALFACAFNLLIGFTGLLSFGHAAFFGGAAYITGHALKMWGLPFELGYLLHHDHARAGADAVLRIFAGAIYWRRRRLAEYPAWPPAWCHRFTQ